LTRPVDITDPSIAKAYAHPLRIQILSLLEDRVASPNQLANELGASLSTTSYHVRQLATLKLIKMVKRRMRRGAVEHYYTATVRPTITDTGWSRVPAIVKRALIGGKIAQAGEEVATAAERGGFDREDIHYSRTRLRLTPDAWQQASEVLERALVELDSIRAASAAALEEDPDADVVEATALMMFFETFVPFEAHSTAEVLEDDLSDLAAHGG
jgi:DNA-binding transcriptional ArsR family regulator